MLRAWKTAIRRSLQYCYVDWRVEEFDLPKNRRLTLKHTYITYYTVPNDFEIICSEQVQY